MDLKKIKLALLKKKNKEFKSPLKSDCSIKIPKYISNKNINKNQNSLLSIYSNKKFNISMSPEKSLNLSDDIFPSMNVNNIANIDLLKEKLIKTKEICNQQSHELYKLRLKYNKLYNYHEENLKLLNSIINKAGVNTNNLSRENISYITNNCDFSHIISNKEKENLKEKHLISCYKIKILEYQYLLDKKNEEISKIKNSSRISKLSRLESDNACKSLENINLSKEKQKLNEKIISMENIMGSLCNRCEKLEINGNKNLNNIEELQNKIKILVEDNNLKDNIIDKCNKKINKNREEYRILEKKIKNLEAEINIYKEEKKNYKKFLDEKEKYELNDENMKKKVENVKNENEKLLHNYNLMKKENIDNFNKYENIRKEKEKFLINKEESKLKIKDKDKQIKTINEQIQNKEEKGNEIGKKIENMEKVLKNNDETENFKKLNNLYKENENNHLEEINLLKQKIQKLEEKNVILNKSLL